MSQQLRRGNQYRQRNPYYNNYDLMNSRSDLYGYSPAQGSSGGFSDRDGGYGGHSGGGGYGHSGGGYGHSGGGYGHSGGGYSSPSYGGYGYSSGSVYGSHSGYGKMDCPGIPIALLLITLLGIAVMGFILFTKIQGAGRKKRSLSELFPDLEDVTQILILGRNKTKWPIAECKNCFYHIVD